MIQGESDRTVWNKKQGDICQAGSNGTGGSALSHSNEQDLACSGKGKGAGRGELLEEMKQKRTNSKKVVLLGEEKKKKEAACCDNILQRNSPGFTSVTIKRSLAEMY